MTASSRSTTPPRVMHCSLCGAAPEPGTFAAHAAEHQAQLAERFPGYRVACDIMTIAETHPGLAEMRAESLAAHYFSLLSQVVPQAHNGAPRDALYIDTATMPDGSIRVELRGRVTGQSVVDFSAPDALAVFIIMMRLWMQATHHDDSWMVRWLEFTEVLAAHARREGLIT